MAANARMIDLNKEIGPPPPYSDEDQKIQSQIQEQKRIDEELFRRIRDEHNDMSKAYLNLMLIIKDKENWYKSILNRKQVTNLRGTYKYISDVLDCLYNEEINFYMRRYEVRCDQDIRNTLCNYMLAKEFPVRISFRIQEKFTHASGKKIAETVYYYEWEGNDV